MLKLQRGLFIVIEGQDGAGKTTLAKNLEALMRGDGFEVLLTKEPTDSPYGKAIRTFANSKSGFHTTPLRHQTLFVLDRGDHLEQEILPALERGVSVISDRYIPSTVAYGVAAGLDMDLLLSMNQDYPKPDIWLVVKVSSEEVERRLASKKQQSSLETFEETEFQSKVRSAYDELWRRWKNDIVILDGDKDPHELAQDAFSVVWQTLTN